VAGRRRNSLIFKGEMDEIMVTPCREKVNRETATA
jgi:RNase P/RNase MRP subunit p30